MYSKIRNKRNANERNANTAIMRMELTETIAPLLEEFRITMEKKSVTIQKKEIGNLIKNGKGKKFFQCNELRKKLF